MLVQNASGYIFGGGGGGAGGYGNLEAKYDGQNAGLYGANGDDNEDADTGGLAGKAIALNEFTVTFGGGDDSDHLKGLVA